MLTFFFCLNRQHRGNCFRITVIVYLTSNYIKYLTEQTFAKMEVDSITVYKFFIFSCRLREPTGVRHPGSLVLVRFPSRPESAVLVSRPPVT